MFLPGMTAFLKVVYYTSSYVLSMVTISLFTIAHIFSQVKAVVPTTSVATICLTVHKISDTVMLWEYYTFMELQLSLYYTLLYRYCKIMTQTFGITLIKILKFIMKSYYLNCIYVTPFLIIAQSLKNCNTKTYPILPQVHVLSFFFPQFC